MVFELPDCELLGISSRLHAILTNNPTGTLLTIALAWTQLELGTSALFLPRTWVTGLWAAISSCHLTFTFPQAHFQTLLQPPKLRNQHLTDVFLRLKFSSSQLTDLNYCRLFLRVIFMSDIAYGSNHQRSLYQPFGLHDIY